MLASFVISGARDPLLLDGKGLKFNLLFALNSNIAVSCSLHALFQKIANKREGNR